MGLKRPKLRNTIETYASQLLGKGVVRSAPLEAPSTKHNAASTRSLTTTTTKPSRLRCATCKTTVKR